MNPQVKSLLMHCVKQMSIDVIIWVFFFLCYYKSGLICKAVDLNSSDKLCPRVVVRKGYTAA